ncbi:PTS glucose transporter subunit IIA [Enterococcus faecium]|uniref:PTS glucose transporter subunit IIA n=1 Tax=Enterococcus faecium TaxID=1352 RepID=UPI00215DA5AB|nr:PTS glucose transporter subunit IIA [Enterococcus faecium]
MHTKIFGFRLRSSSYCISSTIGIQSQDGIEILIHIGIDTVELEGKYFNLNIKQGDKIQRGQLLGTVDFDKIQEAGYDTSIIVVVTNTDSYLDVIPSNSEQVIKTDNLLNVIL